MSSSVVGGLRPAASALTGAAEPGFSGSTFDWETELTDVDLGGFDPAVPVDVVPVVVQRGDSRERVDEGGVGPQLVGESGVRGAEQRPPILAERPGRADPRLDRSPRDRIAGVAAVAHGRQQLRKAGVGGDAGGKVPRLLVVEPGADVHREVRELNRVGKVGVVEIVDELHVRSPGHGCLRGLLEGVAHERVARPGRRRLDVGVPVAEAELELVLQRSGSEEGGRRHPGVVLRSLGVLRGIAVPPHVVHVRVGLLVEAALGRRGPVNRHVGVIERRKELLRQDLRVLHLVGRARPVDVQSRGFRALRTGVAAVDAALEAQVGEGQRVRRRELGGQLAVQVLVRLLAAHRFTGRKEEGLAEIGVGGRRAEDPGAILPQRSAGLDAVIPLRAVGVERPRGSGDLVRAALGHEVDRHAGARQRWVGAAGGYADALERVEVEGNRGQAADRDARPIEGKRVLVRGGALPDERRQRRAVGVSRVHTIEKNSRDLTQDRTEVTRRGDVAELQRVVRRTCFDLPGIEGRRAAAHHDRLHGGVELQGDLHDRVSSDLDRQLASGGAKAAPGEFERVEARGDAEEPEVAVDPRRRGSGVWSCEERFGARDRRSLLVERRAVDVPGRRRNLSSGQRRKQRRHHRRDAGRSRFHIRPERCRESGTGCPGVSTRRTPGTLRLTARSESLRRRRRTRGRNERSGRRPRRPCRRCNGRRARGPPESSFPSRGSPQG